MDNANIKNLNRYAPIVTGTPQVAGRTSTNRTVPNGQNEGTPSFSEVLRQKVEQNSEVSFSKHAAARVAQRSVELTASSLERLNEGVRIAREKGLGETLILVDRTAFLVSAKNNTVITTLGGDDLKGNVFTNIDGTVII